MEEEQLLTGDEQEDGVEREGEQEEEATIRSGREKWTCSGLGRLLFGTVERQNDHIPRFVDCFVLLTDQVFPQLNSGQEPYSRKRSVAVLLALYSSHAFSAWVSCNHTAESTCAKLAHTPYYLRVGR